MGTSVKSCTVMYRSCDRELEQSLTGNSTVERPNYIEFQLDSGITSLDCFMYTVTANNDTHTVIVEDTRSTQSSELSILFECSLWIKNHFILGTSSQVVVIAVVVSTVAVVVAIIIVINLLLVIKGKLSVSAWTFLMIF